MCVVIGRLSLVVVGDLSPRRTQHSLSVCLSVEQSCEVLRQPSSVLSTLSALSLCQHVSLRVAMPTCLVDLIVDVIMI